jgi:hypothetical protein
VEDERSDMERTLTWQDHGLDAGEEENVHRSETLATHDIHSPAEEDLSADEACPDERPCADRNHVCHKCCESCQLMDHTLGTSHLTSWFTPVWYGTCVDCDEVPHPNVLQIVDRVDNADGNCHQAEENQD